MIINDIIQEIPQFTPYGELEICNNTVGTRFLIKMVDYYPIIIGKGERPRIWLYAKVGKRFVALVKDSIPQIIQMKLEIINESMKFFMQNYVTKEWVPILFINFSNKVKPNIYLIDLRPLGIRMYGDKNQLNYGGTSISQETIFGSNVLVNVVK